MSKLKFTGAKDFKRLAKEGDISNIAVRKQFVPEDIKSIDEETRKVRFVISTQAVDRDKDTINPKGFELGNYKKNPVVLFAHDNSKPPIAKASDIKVEGGKLKATAEFMDKDLFEFSDMIFRMIKGGFIKATSVGFLPTEFEFADQEDKSRQGGVDFMKQELLEFSIVPVPSNPEALLEANAKGINTEPLQGWFEEALDSWTEYKDMLLVPRKKVEDLAMATKTSKVFNLSKAEQNDLLAKNLQAVKEQETTPSPEELTLKDLGSDAVTKGKGDDVRMLARIANRVYNTPLMIQQQKAETILGVLGDRIGWMASEMDKVSHDERQSSFASYKITDEGVAVIPVDGTLVNRGAFVSSYSGMTSYEAIGKQFDDAMDRDDVKAVVLDIDSPGGECAGCFDLSDKIYQARGIKPIWAVVNDMAYSAAYAIASAADEIIVSRTGGVGSVGVICVHVDQSVALEQAGLNYTFIYAGDKKKDGNSAEPLSDEVRSDMQKEVDRLYHMFVDTVARNRNISPESVMETEADTFGGEQGLEKHLADHIMAPATAIKSLIDSYFGVREDLLEKDLEDELIDNFLVEELAGDYEEDEEKGSEDDEQNDDSDEQDDMEDKGPDDDEQVDDEDENDDGSEKATGWFIKTDGTPHGTFIVDKATGEALQNVVGIEFSAYTDSVPTITVELLAGDLEIEADDVEAEQVDLNAIRDYLDEAEAEEKSEEDTEEYFVLDEESTEELADSEEAEESEPSILVDPEQLTQIISEVININFNKLSGKID